MEYIEKGDLIYNTFEIFKDYESSMFAAFSTRKGGYSSGCYSSMNLGLSTGDDRNIIQKNYEKFCEELCVDSKAVVLSDQTHDKNIRIVSRKDAGKGFVREKDYKGIDGLITNERNLPLMTYHADCTPIIFFDPVKNVVGLAHAGWRGTALSIATEMISKMKDKYGSKENEIKVAIGPAICGKCYEVGVEVKEALELLPIDSKQYIENHGDKYFPDLANINKALLKSVGVLDKNIECSNTCTKENSHMYFSHREFGNKRGTQVAVAYIK